MRIKCPDMTILIRDVVSKEVADEIAFRINAFEPKEPSQAMTNIQEFENWWGQQWEVSLRQGYDLKERTYKGFARRAWETSRGQTNRIAALEAEVQQAAYKALVEASKLAYTWLAHLTSLLDKDYQGEYRALSLDVCKRLALALAKIEEAKE